MTLFSSGSGFGRDLMCHMRRWYWLAILSFGAAALLADEPTPVAKIMQEAETAYFVEDRKALDALTTRIEGWSSRSRPIEVYAYAYTQFMRLQLAVLSGDDKGAKQAGARCTETLESVLQTQKNFAEGYALQSACYGYLANLGGFAAIRNGSRSGKAIEAALALAPANPRVKLIDGFGVFFRPAFVGGDKAQGCQKFSAAVEAFGKESSERSRALEGYDWGAAEALYFHGRCLRDAGDDVAAAAAFAQAVEQAPEFKRALRAIGR